MAAAEPTRYFPVFLNLEGRNCAVVGGGPVAERKVRSLVASGARVAVIGPERTQGLEALSAENLITMIDSDYRNELLDNVELVVAATDSADINKAVAARASELGALINVVDQPAISNFIVPSVVDRRPMQLAVVTGSPALTTRIRRRIEEQFGPEFAALAEDVRAERARMIASVPDPAERERLINELVEERLNDLDKRQASCNG